MTELFQFEWGADTAPAQHQPSRHINDNRIPEGSAFAELERRTTPLGARVSQLSRKSLVAKFMALDELARDAFEERAAILEIEGGLPRDKAEAKALAMIIKAYQHAA